MESSPTLLPESTGNTASPEQEDILSAAPPATTPVQPGSASAPIVLGRTSIHRSLMPGQPDTAVENTDSTGYDIVTGNAAAQEIRRPRRSRPLSPLVPLSARGIPLWRETVPSDPPTPKASAPVFVEPPTLAPAAPGFVASGFVAPGFVTSDHAAAPPVPAAETAPAWNAPHPVAPPPFSPPAFSQPEDNDALVNTRPPEPAAGAFPTNPSAMLKATVPPPRPDDVGWSLDSRDETLPPAYLPVRAPALSIAPVQKQHTTHEACPEAAPPPMDERWPPRFDPQAWAGADTDAAEAEEEEKIDAPGMGRGRRVTFYTATATVLMMLAIAGYARRDDVMRHIPSSIRFYSTIGLQHGASAGIMREKPRQISAAGQPGMTVTADTMVFRAEPQGASTHGGSRGETAMK